MASWQCGLCSHVCDETKEDAPFGELPDDWACPTCGSGKASFVRVDTPHLPSHRTRCHEDVNRA